MKKAYPILVLFILLLQFKSTAQLSFTLPPASCRNSTVDIVAQGTTGVSSYTWSSMPGNAIFTAPNSPTTAIVFGSTGGHIITLTTNTGTYTQTIIVSTPMNFVALQNSVSTCIQSNFPKFSKPVQIVTYGASTCTWNPILPSPIAPPVGNPQLTVDVRPSVTTCYTITGFAGACNATFQTCVVVRPQFTFDVLGNFEYCEPNPATCIITNISPTVSAPFTYLWTEPMAAIGSINNNLVQQVEIRPSQAATYTVEVRDSEQCVSLPIVFTISKTSCVSIDELSTAEFFQVNFSAAHQKINITSAEAGNLMIIDTQGRCVTSTGKISELEISTDTWAGGIYYCKWKTNNGERCKKIVVLK